MQVIAITSRRGGLHNSPACQRICSACLRKNSSEGKRAAHSPLTLRGEWAHRDCHAPARPPAVRFRQASHSCAAGRSLLITDKKGLAIMRGSGVFLHCDNNVASFWSTSETVSEGKVHISSTFRARQSRLLIWSDKIAPATGNLAGMRTSNGYPLT